MEELMKQLEEAIGKTITYFKSHIQKDGSFDTTDAKDLSCYYKVPMMLIEAGQPNEAKSVLDYIQKTYMTNEGDFKTSPSNKSDKPEYSVYWAYMNGWIIRAAQKLDMAQITEPGDEFLKKFIPKNKKGCLTNHPDEKNEITDVLSTAHLGLINLEQRNFNLAKICGNYLCEALQTQPQSKAGFFLRFDNQMRPITNFNKENEVFYYLDKNKPDQLYFMIGYPCAYLALLYNRTGEKKYLEAAKSYFDIALSCDNFLYQNGTSHKIAWAASILYESTLDEKYLDALKKIVRYFISMQSDNGLWYRDKDINTAYDQSAEIACWFECINKNLKNVKKNSKSNSKPILNYSSFLQSNVTRWSIMTLIGGIGLYTIYHTLNNDENSLGPTQDLDTKFKL